MGRNPLQPGIEILHVIRHVIEAGLENRRRDQRGEQDVDRRRRHAHAENDADHGGECQHDP